MKTCKQCRAEIVSEVDNCPACGSPLNTVSPLTSAPPPEAVPSAPIGDYSALERKIRRARLRKDMVIQWAKVGGVIGLLGSAYGVVSSWSTLAKEGVWPLLFVALLPPLFMALEAACLAWIIDTVQEALAAMFARPRATKKKPALRVGVDPERENTSGRIAPSDRRLLP